MDEDIILKLSVSSALSLLKELTNMTRLDAKIPVPELSKLEADLYFKTNSSRR